jgi:hypothetical protein
MNKTKVQQLVQKLITLIGDSVPDPSYDKIDNLYFSSFSTLLIDDLIRNSIKDSVMK